MITVNDQRKRYGGYGRRPIERGAVTNLDTVVFPCGCSFDEELYEDENKGPYGNFWWCERHCDLRQKLYESYWSDGALTPVSQVSAYRHMNSLVPGLFPEPPPLMKVVGVVPSESQGSTDEI